MITRFLLLALVVGCNDDGVIPALPVGATAPVETPVFAADGTLLEPRGDADGDGIPNQDEVDGYDITVDTNGFAVLNAGGILQEMLELRHVSSDPRVADSDDDGLDDREERMYTSDPRRRDSDGDTLSDPDEVVRYGTSPVSIDTDGDARGGDPANLRPPLFELFDAAELRLGPDPANPGGPFVPGPGATNPWDSNTDGDQLNDYDELFSGLRRATVAEMPEVAIYITRGSRVSLGFNYTDAMGRRDTTRFVDSLEQAAGFFANQTTRLGTRLFLSSENGAFVNAEASVGTSDGGSVEEGVYSMSEQRWEQSLGLDFSGGASLDVSQTFNEATEAERTREITVDSGTLRISFDVVNRGIIPFRLTDLTVAAFFVGGVRDDLIPLTELSTDDEIVLGPGESRTVIFARTDIEVGPMRQLMANPQSLLFYPARYSMTDVDDVDFDFREEEVRARTAHITIDFGQDIVERDVAALAFATGRSATVGQLLTEMGVDFEASEIPGSPGNFAVRIRDLETELHTGAAPDLMDPLPYTERSADGPGPRRIRRGWFARVLHRDELPGDQPLYANLFEAPVRAHDIVTLVYTEDIDRDGVPSIEEERYGSSDLTVNSDEDGLSDFFEIRERWGLDVVGLVPYLARPDPDDDDTDDDGLTDLEEAEAHTDPRRQDTDFDGLSDRRELDEAYPLDPTRGGEIIDGPAVTCVAANEAADPSAPRRCVVSLLPAFGAAEGAERLTLDCSQLTLQPCRVRIRFGAPFPGEADGETGANACYRYNHPSGRVYQIPVAVMNELNGGARFAGATVVYAGGVATARGGREGDRSPYCEFLVQAVGGPFLDQDWRGDTDSAISVSLGYAIQPCRAWRDLDGDGACETGPDSVFTTPTALAFGTPPACSDLVVPADPRIAFSISATDPQDDLVSVDFRVVDGMRPFAWMHYDVSATGSAVIAERVLHTCDYDPRLFSVEVTDRYGATAHTPCTFVPSGSSCVE